MKNYSAFLGILLLFACSENDEEPMNNPFSLDSTWERTSAEVPELVGMIVNVSISKGEAVVTSVGNNSYGFVIGDVKWRNIASSGNETFTFEDLGRDMQGAFWYSDANISVLTPDKITIEISTSSSGNTQTWERR